MKSKVKFPWFTPRAVKYTFKEVISEWEHVHNIVGKFSICRKSGVFHLEVDCHGELYLCVNHLGLWENFYHLRNDILLLGERGYMISCIPAKGTYISKRYLPDLSEALGVSDITNIQPHEYGLLKLKYGFGKRDIFVPSVIIKQYSTGVGGRYTINRK